MGLPSVHPATPEALHGQFAAIHGFAHHRDTSKPGRESLCRQKAQTCNECGGPSGVLTAEGMQEFFSYLAGPQPNLAHMSPRQALHTYTAERGGNPEKTVDHFENSEVLMPASTDRRNNITYVRRNIASPHYATSRVGDGVGWTKLLCCFDDPLLGCECKRTACPYRHATEHASGEQDLFQLIPCTFAGM